MQRRGAGRKVNAPPNGGAGCYANSCTYRYAGPYAYRYTGTDLAPNRCRCYPGPQPGAHRCAGPYTYRYAGTDPAPNRCPCYPDANTCAHRYPDAGGQDRRGVPE